MKDVHICIVLYFAIIENKISRNSFLFWSLAVTAIKKAATQVMGALDEKLVWLDEFNKNIIDYDKVQISVYSHKRPTVKASHIKWETILPRSVLSWRE